ncbi:retrovirus-related pol polyprotein from transposon TNT 1-94 [Tanacetum coccineum]
MRGQTMKKNVDMILKVGNSLQGMFMLGPKPLSLYNQQLKHGLGYPNPYTLQQAISKCPKLYVASSLGNLEIPLDVIDSEDTLEDAFKNFVPQKELSAKQKYFSSSSIPSVKIPVSKNMPSESPLIKELDKIKGCFEKLSVLIQQNCKRASIFYTSPAEIQINDFCQDQVKPILNELKVYLDFFQNLFQRDIKEMKDVFESTESELDELEKQNGVVERCNRTLVEAARTMLIFSRLPKFLWAKAVATACFTQNRSIIHTRYNKTPYELLRGQKPNIAYFHVFGSLCYPTNDRDDLGKMKPKADIGVFIGYSETSTGF